MQVTVFQLSPDVLSAAAVVFAALIGFGSRLVLDWVERRRTRMKVRQALQVELESMEWIDGMDLRHLKSEIRAGGSLPTSHVPTQMYEEHRGDVGLLSYDERTAVIRYYQAARVAQNQLVRIEESDGEQTHVRSAFADRTLVELTEWRKEAATEIDKRLTLRGRIRTRLFSPLAGSLH